MQKKIWRKPIIEDLIAKNTQANFSCENYTAELLFRSANLSEEWVPRPGVCCRCDGFPDGKENKCVYAGKGPGCSA